MTLSLEYCPRRGICFTSSLGKVFWNNVLVGNITPTDYSIHTFTVNVTADVGLNVLRLEGAGRSDSIGLTIDNVKLVQVGTTQNIMVNGDF